MLEYSGPSVVRLLGSSGNIIVLAVIDCVFTLVSRHLRLERLYLGAGVLSLLGGCFVLWFLFPLLFLGVCGVCVLPV